MRFYLLIFALLVQQLAEARTIPATRAEVLDNGVRIILQEDHSKPRVSVTTLWRTDHFAQHQQGIAHFAQHVLAHGTNAEDIHKLVKSSNLQLREDSVPDASWYEADMPKSALSDFLKADRKRFDAVDFSKENLRRVREELGAELSSILEDSTIQALSPILFLQAFNDKAYRLGQIPSEKYAASIGPGDLDEFYLNNYRASALTISIVGDFDGKAVFEQLRGLWSSYPEVKVTKVVYRFDQTSYEKPETRSITIDGDAEQHSVLMGFEIPDARHTDTAALDILGTILAKAESGRLNMALISTKKASEVLATNYLTLRPHLFVIGAVGYASVPEKLMNETILEQLRSITDIKEADFKRIKDKVIDEFLASTSERGDLARNLAQYDLFYGSYLSYFGREEEYRKVTVHDISRVIFKYFLSVKPHKLIVTKQKPQV